MIEVKVFGMDNCSGCTTVKNVLKRKGVEYVERDVMNVNHMDEANKYGVRSVPTTVITWDTGEIEVVVGSNRESVIKIENIILAGV